MQRRKPTPLSLRRNLIWYYGAIGIIMLGYISLAIGSADSFTSRTLGPVIIVIGYLIAVPVALIAGVLRKDRDDAASSGQESAIETTSPKKSR